MPWRPRGSIAPTAARLCHASLTVVGDTPSCSRQLADRRQPGAGGELAGRHQPADRRGDALGAAIVERRADQAVVVGSGSDPGERGRHRERTVTVRTVTKDPLFRSRCDITVRRMANIVRAALLQTDWPGTKDGMLDKHEEAAHDAKRRGRAGDLLPGAVLRPVLLPGAGHRSTTRTPSRSPTVRRRSASRRSPRSSAW